VHCNKQPLHLPSPCPSRPTTLLTESRRLSLVAAQAAALSEVAQAHSQRRKWQPQQRPHGQGCVQARPHGQCPAARQQCSRVGQLLHLCCCWWPPEDAQLQLLQPPGCFRATSHPAAMMRCCVITLPAAQPARVLQMACGRSQRQHLPALPIVGSAPSQGRGWRPVPHRPVDGWHHLGCHLWEPILARKSNK
jgi:hypothetical protein